MNSREREGIAARFSISFVVREEIKNFMNED